MKQFVKAPEEVLDYQLDLKPLTHGGQGAKSDYLETGESITTHTVSADSGVTVDSSSESDGKITAWLSGGTLGQTYTVICKFETSAGRTGSRAFALEIRRR